MTKICIFGAGAIGGYMAHALIKAGADVSLIARGPHLEGLRDKGLTLIKEGSAETLPVKATDTPEELGPQDYVISALKAHSVAPVIDRFNRCFYHHVTDQHRIRPFVSETRYGQVSSTPALNAANPFTSRKTLALGNAEGNVSSNALATPRARCDGRHAHAPRLRGRRRER